MLTDTALRNLKPKSLTYKASDRDGMYVTVSPTGTVTFRYDYRLNGRRETLTIGRYGSAGISLAMAREKLIDAKKAVAQGKSPALEKQREKRRLTAAKTFGDVTEKWLAGARMPATKSTSLWTFTPSRWATRIANAEHDSTYLPAGEGRSGGDLQARGHQPHPDGEPFPQTVRARAVEHHDQRPLQSSCAV